jgi:hypothetical protein
MIWKKSLDNVPFPMYHDSISSIRPLSQGKRVRKETKMLENLIIADLVAKSKRVSPRRPKA